MPPRYDHFDNLPNWSFRWDSNPQHRDYKSRPLPNCDTEADVSLNKLFNFVSCKRVFIKYYDSNIINL